jgi:predicted HTH domain antitoxin
MGALVLEIPEAITPEEARLDLAIALFAQEKDTFGAAREIAGLTTWACHQELGRRRIAVHYDVAEFAEDVATPEGGRGDRCR